MGHVDYKTVKIIPGIRTEYSKDSKLKKGSFYIHLKDGSRWSICYEFKTFVYFPPKAMLAQFMDIHRDDLKLTEGRWEIEDSGCDFKIISHSIKEIEKAEELIGSKVTKSIPEATLEYYRKDKILKIPFYNDEIRIFIKNGNLEYIRNDKKIIKVIPLNKEVHLYGIEPRIRRYLVTPKGTELIYSSN
ncbi:MAG: hypothetical protein QXY79_00040 [Candidatus Methanomethylicia archaeon]